DDLAGRARGGFLVDYLEDLPVGLRQLRPQRPADDGEQRVGDVRGEVDVRLHLVELLRVYRGQGILLCLHRAVLQREVDLGKGDRGGVGADRAREERIQGRIRHADLQS